MGRAQSPIPKISAQAFSQPPTPLKNSRGGCHANSTCLLGAALSWIGSVQTHIRPTICRNRCFVFRIV